MKIALFLLFSLVSAASPDAAPGKAPGMTVACVDTDEGGRGCDTLADLAAACGYDGENVLPALRKGEFLLSRYKIVLFGSYSTRDPAVRAFLDGRTEELRAFVRKGGCLVFFTQHGSDRKVEQWLLPGMCLLRGAEPYDRVGYVDRKHPLFSRPNAIDHRRIARDWKEHPVVRDPFRVALRGRVLAARDAKGTAPACVEFGWGRGRVIFYAFRPELPAERPPETKRLARDLVENALAYAVEVVRGRPAPLPDSAVVVEKRTGYKPLRARDGTANTYAFEREVDRAVDRGTAFLLKRQRKNGGFGAYGKHAVGPTALAVLAVLGAGVNKYSTPVEKAMDFILAHPPDRYTLEAYTYDIALSMMALDAWSAPMYERFELERLPPDKRERFKFERELSDREKRFMNQCLHFLVTTQLETGYWTYGPSRSGSRGDLSNTQFAVLGLKAADRCGCVVPKETWTRLVDALLEAQARDGPRVSLPEFQGFERKTGKPRFYVVPARARSWGYGAGTSGMGGSRCAMGISSLLIAQECLTLHHKRTADRYRSHVRRAVRDGLAHLWSCFSVTENPHLGARHLYYYLYSLERVGVLFGKPYIGDRDWYREGSVFLLERQEASGAWNRDMKDTAFALLFLKRSTPPPVTTLSH